MQVDEERRWMTPYHEYFEVEKLPKDTIEAWRIAAEATNYQTIRTLYRRGKSSPQLRRVGPKEASRIV